MTNKEKRRWARFAMRYKESPFFTISQYLLGRRYLVSLTKNFLKLADEYKSSFPLIDFEQVEPTEEDMKNGFFRMKLKIYSPQSSELSDE